MVRVRYAIGGIAAAALLAVPAGAAAKQGGQVESLAVLQCNQERADIGKRAFLKRYGAKHTLRACSKRTRPQVNAAMGTAAGDCQDELDQDGAAEFIDDNADYGTDSLDTAMQECIAMGVDEILNPDDYVDDGSDG